jgi:hypothetical protein
MRTTVDLPDDLHRIVNSLALHTQRSMSQTAAELIRRGLSSQVVGSGASAFTVHAKTRLPVVSSSRAITPEDVKALEDEA